MEGGRNGGREGRRESTTTNVYKNLQRIMEGDLKTSEKYDLPRRSYSGSNMQTGKFAILSIYKTLYISASELNYSSRPR